MSESQSLQFETQTPGFVSLTPTSKEEIIPAAKPWGRLYSTYLRLKPADLESDSFSFGRASECDQPVNELVIKPTLLTSISKSHFLITRDENSIVYITDLSKNGTYINGQLIGKYNKHILANDDEIAIGLKSFKVYVFKSMLSTDNFLPMELRQKYHVSRLLGRGAVGEVKLVFNKFTCLPYAVKKIVKVHNPSKRALNDETNIARELKILKSLKNPFIVKLYEIMETHSAVFMVLEYMEGGELSNVICNGFSLSEAHVKFIFLQMVQAVKYLHENGIIHRDLKPDNILLSKKDDRTLVKISDFGLSKILEDGTFLRTLCGTPQYVAPEIIDRSIAEYDSKVDIWSMGVILFLMLARKLPFEAHERRDRNELILSGRYSFEEPVWKGKSKEVKDLIGKMLVVNAAERFSINEVLQHDWIQKDIVVQEQVKDAVDCNAETASPDPSDTEPSDTSPPTKRSRLSYRSLSP